VVFDVVLKFDGSISAEHGIGRLKKHHMPEIVAATAMMRDLKNSSIKQHHESWQGAARRYLHEVQDVNLERSWALKACDLTRPWNDPQGH
jgi:hypothetical protein